MKNANAYTSFLRAEKRLINRLSGFVPPSPKPTVPEPSPDYPLIKEVRVSPTVVRRRKITFG